MTAGRNPNHVVGCSTPWTADEIRAYNGQLADQAAQDMADGLGINKLEARRRIDMALDVPGQRLREAAGKRKRLARYEGGWTFTLGPLEVKGRKLMPGARLDNGFPHIGQWNIAWGRRR